MEQFIPLLIGLAYFIFKTYSNFRKEQDKARKRNIAKPDTYSDYHSQERKRTTTYEEKPVHKSDPFLFEETTGSGRSFEPNYKYSHSETATKAELTEKTAESLKKARISVSEGYNPEEVADEVATSRKIHKPHKHKSIKVDHQEESQVFEFDMRDAVIKQAILNRPQY